MGKNTGDIEQVYIAGAFGNCINKYSAIKIGLLPHIDEERIVWVGNEAGTGVSIALVSEREMDSMKFSQT